MENDKVSPYRSELLKHKDKCSEFQEHSLKQIDSLIILISGAGIYTVYEIFKYLKEQRTAVDDPLIKWAGILFASAIVLCFFGQWFSYFANRRAYSWADDALCSDSPEDHPEFRSNWLTVGVHVTNILSTLAMAAGTFETAYFTFVTF